MSNNQTEDTITKEQGKRVIRMLNDICQMFEECNKATESIDYWDGPYTETYKAELDKRCKARLFADEETGWSWNDIYTFLGCLENHLYKMCINKSLDYDFRFLYNILECHGLLELDYEDMPFGKLYKAFIDILYANYCNLTKINDEIKEKEAKIA